MLALPKMQLIRHRQQIRNPSDQLLVVVVEPWADRFELKAEETIDIVFVGPEAGQPEVLPYPGELIIYGWDGSEVVVLKDGSMAAQQPSVSEIVRQEFQIAEKLVRRTETRWPVEEITIVDQKLDIDTDMSVESQEFACDLAGYLVCELATTLERSDAAAALLWQIADRVVGRKGIVLAATNQNRLKTAAWSNRPQELFHMIWSSAISVLPGPADLAAYKRKSRSATRRSAGSESGPTPH
jgi:hypothetical protein